MPHEFESGFFVAKPAWHGLGKVLNNPPTTQQAIVEADLDWIVEEHPIYQSPEPYEYTSLPNYKLLIRSSDRQTLGVVGKNYKPLQNQDAFKWFDFLLHEGNVSLEAAGSLKRG
ncbi:DUF932 domain-containing protein, partial [Myxosarcina sp. GI1]|uniref:DUF932 domain-containing protein n=1 Tax=Myxosarcina sp. GI1 TaxID=1541065 RepID=UPI00056A1B67